MATVDEALVRKAQGGDRRAFGRLVEAHHASLRSAARALVGDAEAADDVSQEAFVEAYTSLPRLEQPARFRAWLFAIMRHRALNYLRGARRQAAWVATEAEPETVSDNTGRVAGASDAVLAKLDALPERHREVLAAKYLQGLSYQEIADSLGLTVNAVRVRCHRAKDEVRELLSQGMEPSAAGEGAEP